ncbi:MAG: hypothetical protein MZV70_01860 [Desulfobacterales bacterium]|nr:hypothetical protein [Desulfobacterales bacterium]
MIRVAHFSDLHYGTRTLAEADRCFGAAIDRAIALRVEAAVISGDATDHALDLHAPAAVRLIAQVRRLADHCPVLMLQGTYSHEPPGTLAVFRLLGGRHPVHVADRIGQVALDRCAASGSRSKGWRFDARAAGCPRAVQLRADGQQGGGGRGGRCRRRPRRRVGEHLADLLRGYAPIHRAARAQGLPTIGVSHGTVFGCISEHGVPMAGFDHEFTTGCAVRRRGPGLHARAHPPASVVGGRRRGGAAVHRLRRVRSAASTTARKGDKGFLLWEVGAGRGALRAGADTGTAHAGHRVRGQARPRRAASRWSSEQQVWRGASSGCAGRSPTKTGTRSTAAAIQRLLAGAAEVKLEGRIVPVVRTRAAGISKAGSVAQMLAAWAGTAEVHAKPLLDRLAQLSVSSPEEIAQAIVAGATGGEEDARDASLCSG